MDEDENLRRLQDAYRSFVLAVIDALTEEEIKELNERYLKLYKKDHGRDQGNE